MTDTNRKPIPYTEAYDQVLKSGIEFAKTKLSNNNEIVSIEDGRDRILASDIKSKETLPKLPLSERDGYTFAAPAGDTRFPVTLNLKDEIRAGIVCGDKCTENEAFRIFTGAPLPEGSNTVLMQEFAEVKTCEDGKKQLIIANPYKEGQFVRPIGCDCKEGDVLIKKGSKIRSEHIGLLASLGITYISVKKKPGVAFLVTGDELVCHTSSTVPAGKIRNSNIKLIENLIKAGGGNPVYLGTVSDDRQVLLNTMKGGKGCDLLITVGGASVGDYDFVLSCAEELDYDMRFSRIALKPGKPTLFGVSKETLFIGLPGHPVSAAVIFNLLARPLMAILEGKTGIEHKTSTAFLDTDETKEETRQYFLPGTVEEIDGKPVATPSPYRHSSSLQSLTESTVLISLPTGKTHIEKGSKVTVFHIWT